MEQVVPQAANMYIGVFKEPRGFIKIIQVIIAIFAFATTTSHVTQSTMSVMCPGGEVGAGISIHYPFALEEYKLNVTVPLCNATAPKTHMYTCCNFNSSSQFYVFIGVMAFLYSLAAIVLYICFDDLYRKNDKIPIIDFVVTAIFTFFWLVSSAAWAHSLNEMKYYMMPKTWFDSNHFPQDCPPNNWQGKCTPRESANFASLNVSIIFGFLNMVVWGGNLWFLFKETKWFKVRSDPPIPSPSEQPQQHYQPPQY